MKIHLDDTISAIATAPGEGGIGIVRLSGPDAIEVAGRLFRAANGRPLQSAASHSAHYGKIIDEDGEVIDEAIALVMRAPHSYTAEDVVELQCHGGYAALRATLARTTASGARPAERGEFTKRAFLNGRIDLTQAGAVMDVVSAKTKASLFAASGRLAGRLSTRIGQLRREITELTAHLEAVIDFPEDGVEDIVMDDARMRVSDMAEKIRDMLGGARRGKILRDGLATAIVGKPNVGKSSLMNALLGEERVIVTDSPGTTRDTVEEYARIGEIPIRLIDTAGIREAHDAAEKIGIERARRSAKEAELLFALFDGSRPSDECDAEIASLTEGKDTIVVITKSDLPGLLDESEIRSLLPRFSVVHVSVKTGDGLCELACEIEKRAAGGEGADFLVADERERDLLASALASLENALITIDGELGEDFVTIDLTEALTRLGEITGETVDEAVVDEIFRRFCVGK